MKSIENRLQKILLHTTLAVAAVFVVSPSPAGAQLGFGRVPNQPWSGGVTLMNNMMSKSASDVLGGRSGPGSGAQSASKVGGGRAASALPRTVSRNLMPLITSAWLDARSRMIDSAMAFLNERDVGGGFRTSRNRITIAESGPVFVGVDARGFTMRYVINGNRLSTYFRTPTPMGRDFDPGFTVDFDMDVLIDVELRDNQLIAGPARIEPRIKKPEGRNITGDFAVAVNDLVRLLSGTDFVGYFVKEVNGRNFELQHGLNRELAGFNPVLRAAANGGVILPGFDSGTITLTMRDKSASPVVR